MDMAGTLLVACLTVTAIIRLVASLLDVVQDSNDMVAARVPLLAFDRVIDDSAS